MAVKKSKPVEPTATKAPSKKVEAPTPKKSAAPKAKSVPTAVASDTASKAQTPKPTAVSKSPAVAPKSAAVAPKKAAPVVKLTDRQLDFLKQIQGAKEAGYLLEKKAEQRTIDALLDRKLIKKGAKDKLSGHFRYMVSKAGEKHLSTTSPA